MINIEHANMARKNFNHIPYTIQKGYRRIQQTNTGWKAQEKLFFFWVDLPVMDLNGVHGTVEFESLRTGLKWLDDKQVAANVKY